ncbi:MAG TPA: Ig-like domain-containing protein [Micromonosporaceae bacterium]
MRARFAKDRVAVSVVALLALGLLAGCTTAGARVGTARPTPSTSAVHVPPLPSGLVLAPAGRTNVAPGDPVTAELVNGTLDSVTLTGPDHKAVPGRFDPTRRSWTATPVLAYRATYTLTASGTGADGRRHQASRTFTTARARTFTMARLWSYDWIPLREGGTYGVGQVIVVNFDEPIKDRAAAERNLVVTTDPPVVGAWRWMDSSTVHFRPRTYWPAGTKVRVRANVEGKHLGNGVYGQTSPSVSFAIGRSKIAVADAKTHHMKVYIDGAEVTRINGVDLPDGIPVSLGKNSGERAPNGTWIDFRTASGPHVVLRKSETVRMTSASYGITDPSSPNFYDELIRKAVRISSEGEFVHLADWNIPKHGVENTSHGCINVAPRFIYWFYDQFNEGDVVEVSHTGRKLELRDGLGDWTLSWAAWLSGSMTGSR